MQQLADQKKHIANSDEQGYSIHGRLTVSVFDPVIFINQLLGVLCKERQQHTQRLSVRRQLNKSIFSNQGNCHTHNTGVS